jgi:hypothetical protein
MFFFISDQIQIKNWCQQLGTRAKKIAQNWLLIAKRADFHIFWQMQWNIKRVTVVIELDFKLKP